MKDLKFKNSSLFGILLFFCIISYFPATVHAITDINKVHALVAQGWALENQGRSQEALDLYNQAFQMDPNDFLVHKHLGIHWARENKYEDGIVELKDATELNPLDASSFYNLGLTYQMAKDYPRALTSYSQAIKLNPNYANAIHNRAVVYWELKDYPKAIAIYFQEIQDNPRLRQSALVLIAFLLIGMVLIFLLWRRFLNIRPILKKVIICLLVIIFGILLFMGHDVFTNPNHISRNLITFLMAIILIILRID